MCTIGCANLGKTYIFKNRDPIRGTSTDEWIEKILVNDLKILVIRNNSGCFGGINEYGVGIVGTYVNIIENQNNYFDGLNLITILKQGDIHKVKQFLISNTEKLYGNIICSDGIYTFAFELNGAETNCQLINGYYASTNHFNQINKNIRTIEDPYISNWTNIRLERARELLESANSFNDIIKLLSDHNNYPNFSICNHGEIPTLSSYIIDCSNKSIYYCKGSPCKNAYVRYDI